MHTVRLLSSLLLASAATLAGCSTPEMRAEYEPIQSLGMQIVTTVERDIDLAVRAAAVLSENGTASAEVAISETAAPHPIWPTCVARAAATWPEALVQLDQTGCSLPFGVTDVFASSNLSYSAPASGNGIAYSFATISGYVDLEQINITGGGLISGATADRVITWNGSSESLEAETVDAPVTSSLTIHPELASDAGCRTLDGTASCTQDIGVTVTFQGYRSCRPANDSTQCPSGTAVFGQTGGAELEISFDGSAVAVVSKGVYGATIDLACTP
jgi:hypothetical protein